MARTDTRERMITTAAKLMQRQGYHGTGLNQILAEAKAPKGSMYFHFPGGKDQLAAAAIAASADYVLGVLRRSEAAAAAEALDAYIAGVVDALEARDFATGCPIATVALEVAPAGGEIGEACALAFERLIAHVAGWLERDGLAPDEAADRAFMIYAAIEGRSPSPRRGAPANPSTACGGASETCCHRPAALGWRRSDRRGQGTGGESLG